MECVVSNVPIVFVLCILLNINACMAACWLSPLLCVVITQKAAIATLPLTTHPQWAELYTFTSFIVMCCINNNNKKKKKKKKKINVVSIIKLESLR